MMLMSFAKVVPQSVLDSCFTIVEGDIWLYGKELHSPTLGSDVIREVSIGTNVLFQTFPITYCISYPIVRVRNEAKFSRPNVVSRARCFTVHDQLFKPKVN